jgi:putative PIN family toxin of toxin-antitoxin system
MMHYRERPLTDLPRLVLDTNALLSGLARQDSAAGRILSYCEDRRVLLLISRRVQAEYRRVLSSAEMLRRNPEITSESIELVLRRLRYLGYFVARTSAHFHFERDPDDEPFIELAIEGSASHLVTSDNDLLSLPEGHDDAAKRFRQRLPNLRVLRPAEFLRGIARA